MHREQILDILWPGIDVDSALNSFGKALHAARRAIEPELMPREGSAYLRLTDAMLALNTQHVLIDADQFQELAEAAVRRRDIPSYESALATYSGELLPEDRYEDWCAERRALLVELRLRVLLGLAAALEGCGAYNESANRLREVLQQDPTREEAHRRLMRLYGEMGARDQAVRQFHICETVLRRDLDLAPQRETVSLYQDVLANRIPTRSPTPERDRRRPSSLPLTTAEPAPDTPFVGRAPALHRLRERLMRADEAGAGMVLLSGEAGVGKTRLLVEFAAEVGREGAAVLWGGSGAHPRGLAYGPFAVALEGYAASRPEADRNELARRYPALAPFLPSLGMTAQLPPLADDARDDHLDLVPAIVRLLTDLARRQPVVLVLGDLHDVDPFSLDLLRYLAHLAVGRRWLTVGTVREEEVESGTELRALIDATIHEHLSLKLDLQRLSRRYCDQLVLAMLPGGRGDDKLLEQVYVRSRGNPLFVEELVGGMRDQRDLFLSQGCWHGVEGSAARVPARVRALVAMQLARQDQTLRRVLTLAAAAGPAEISLSALGTGAAALEPPISTATLLDALDRALQIGILEERRGGYAFRYPLVRSALYEDLWRHRREQFDAALGRLPGDGWRGRRPVSAAG
jgi:DNA-binding SARP family transcriptional activator